VALKRLDDLDGAERSLEKAHALSPQDPQVLVNYAVVLDSRKKSARARELLLVLSDVAALIDVDPQVGFLFSKNAAEPTSLLNY
jgi:Flp pilus assembly protein TadD